VHGGDPRREDKKEGSRWSGDMEDGVRLERFRICDGFFRDRAIRNEGGRVVYDFGKKEIRVSSGEESGVQNREMSSVRYVGHEADFIGFVEICGSERYDD
jgi:hypothetical protein